MALLTLVGTGDALGVPRVYCDCPVCAEARTSGANRRTRPSVFVQGTGWSVLIDCGPDWRQQMEVLGQRNVDVVLLTHAHHDHIGGLPDLYDSVRWSRYPTQVIAPPRVMGEVLTRYPWLRSALGTSTLEVASNLFSYRVQSLDVNHGRNGRSFAYRLEAPNFVWAYCPDAICLDAHERTPLSDLDLLILGTAYHIEEAPQERRSIYSMVEAASLLQDIRPKKAIFTHLSHGVDCRSAYVLPPNVAVAHDGLRLELPE